MSRDEAREWAHSEFGHARLGDARRTARLVQMAAGVVRRPGGKVLDVFRSSAERQGAYDFLANEQVASAAMVEALRVATLERVEGYRDCIVSVDGTSLKLKDWKRAKDFGSIGARDKGARGLKVVHAYAVGSDGTPIGFLDQQWWTRSDKTRRADCHKRLLGDKETRHWVDAIDTTAKAFAATAARPWFQLDREGDRYNTLKALARTGALFTVRSTYDRRGRAGERELRLRQAVSKGRIRGEHRVEVRRGSLQKHPRTASLVVRTTTIVLHMSEAPTGESFELEVNVVDACEVGPIPRGAERIHWRLLTNHPIDSNDEVAAV